MSSSIKSERVEYCEEVVKKPRPSKLKISCKCGKTLMSKKSKPKKCIRPGPITINPYLNFLRDFRINHCDYTAKKIIVEGSKLWRKMSITEKQKYYDEAYIMQKKRKKQQNRQ